MTVEEFFRNIFLPFTLTFVLFWAILEGIGRFGRKINLILAFCLTAFAAYGGLFTWFVQYVAQLGAYTGLIAFAIVFILGSIIWAIGRTKEIYHEEIPPKKLEKLNKEIAKLYKKAREAKERGEEDKAKQYVKMAKKLEEEREFRRL